MALNVSGTRSGATPSTGTMSDGGTSDVIAESVGEVTSAGKGRVASTVGRGGVGGEDTRGGAQAATYETQTASTTPR